MRIRAFVVCVAVFAASSLSAQEEKKTEPEQIFIDTLNNGSSFLATEYKSVRAAMSKYFEKKYAEEIRTAFDKDTDTILKFLKDNPELRDTLYTAINPDDDHLEESLRIFRELYNLGPEKLKSHFNVAVAICVVWDEPKSVYDYRNHQVRTRSKLPIDPMTIGWKENYEFLLAREGDLKGVVQNLPWEFLVHMVNNRTPIPERDWAIKNYVKRRAGIGGIYKEIVYDDEMLRTEQKNGSSKSICKLNDHNYTLEEIKKYGGVCAMQADFSARVAKSIAVPAEYIRGEGNSGGLHAWVMWVELKAVTREKVDFLLMSEGRYFGDQFYVGQLKDPKTGKEITDRDMERRLSTIGASPYTARQADLLMRMYPYYKEKKSLTPRQQFEFVKRVFEVFPHCERAWLELANIAKDGKTLEPSDATHYANRAYTLFNQYPDFSWDIYEPIMTTLKDKSQRNQIFERAVLKYEALGRPDLACECRMKWAEYLEESKDYKRATAGLSQTISKFPAEGRYVPKVLDKLADLSTKYPEGKTMLTKFYTDFLPRVPKTRGNDVTDYAVKVHEKVLDFYKANNLTKQATQVEQTLAQLKKAKAGN